MSVSELRYIITSQGATTLVRLGSEPFYRDQLGTIYAEAEDPFSRDVVIRCGVGLIALSPSNALTDACGPHDFAFTSPAYQAFHTRAEADEYLEDLIKQVKPGIWGALIGRWFRIASSLFGGAFWENRKTR